MPILFFFRRFEGCWNFAEIPRPVYFQTLTPSEKEVISYRGGKGGPSSFVDVTLVILQPSWYVVVSAINPHRGKMTHLVCCNNCWVLSLVVCAHFAVAYSYFSIKSKGCLLQAIAFKRAALFFFWSASFWEAGFFYFVLSVMLRTQSIAVTFFFEKKFGISL